jgi:hypothetical protein
VAACNAVDGSPDRVSKPVITFDPFAFTHAVNAVATSSKIGLC